MSGGNAHGDFSLALGNGNYAIGEGTQVLGRFAELGITAGSTAGDYDPAESHPLDYLFVIGNGVDAVNRSNALVIYRNGDADVNGELSVSGSRVLTEDSLELSGSLIRAALVQTNAADAESISWGFNNTLTANNLATAWGRNNRATGEQSTAWGSNTNAKGFGATAWGSGTQSRNTGTTAWGVSAKAFGFGSTAWGTFSEAHGRSSTAWGDNTEARGLQSTVWGLESRALGNYSVAWGLETVAHGVSSTAIGNNTVALRSNSLALGQFNVESSDGLLVVGNGEDEDNRSNSMVVSATGQTTLSNKAWINRAAEVDALDDPSPADALEEGEALVVDGHTRFRGRVVLEHAQGDIPMGIFGQ